MEEKPRVELPAAKRLRRGRTMDEILISQTLIMLRNAGFHGRCPSFTVAAAEESNTSSSAEENHDKPVETVAGAAEVENEDRFSLNSHRQSENNSGDCSQPQEALDGYVIIHRIELQTATDSKDGVPENSASDAENQDQVSPTAVPRAYNGSHCCCVCGKNFKSHQALGGHMTLHRIKPQTATGSDVGGCFSSRVHECSVCHQRFKSGQALGGHQRKHYGGPPLLRKRKTAEPTRPILDLNLPPQPEE